MILECRISSHPIASIKWYKDDFLIKDTPNFIYMQEPDEIYKLIIRVLL